MYKAVIAGYSRSPFTMAKKGDLIDIKPDELLSKVVKNLILKSKINLDDIEDVIIGCAFPEGEQGFNIGKLVTFLSEMNIKTTAKSNLPAFLPKYPSPNESNQPNLNCFNHQNRATRLRTTVDGAFVV